MTCTGGCGYRFSTADDGCCDTRNIYSDFAVNKYLHTVASGWVLLTLNYDARNHELKKKLIYSCVSMMTNASSCVG